MSPCGIVEVLEYALVLCNARENGGRMLVVHHEDGASAGHILDCSCWPDEYSQAVLARYPGCSITFMSAQDVSTTGFTICFGLGARGPPRRKGWGGSAIGAWRWPSLWRSECVGELYHRWSDLALLLLMGGWSVHTLHLVSTHQV